MPSSLSEKFKIFLHNFRSEQHAVGRPDPAVCLTLADAVAAAESGCSLCKITPLARKLRNDLSALSEKMGFSLRFPIHQDKASPYITTILLPPYQGEILTRMLSDKGVMVSAGSACEAWKSKASGALVSMGISAKEARTMLRISFSFNSTEDDINAFIKALEEVISSY